MKTPDAQQKKKKEKEKIHLVPPFAYIKKT